MLEVERPLEMLKPKLLNFKQFGKWVQKLEGNCPRSHNTGVAEPKLEPNSSNPYYRILFIAFSKSSYISHPKLEDMLNSIAIKPRKV